MYWENDIKFHQIRPDYHPENAQGSSHFWPYINA